MSLEDRAMDAAAAPTPRPPPGAGTRAMWRAALSLVLLAALATAAQAALVAQLLAPWRLVVGLLEPDFRVVALRAAQAGADPVVELVIAPARVIIVGERSVAPDDRARARSSTPRGAVWLVLSLFLATLAAWPLQRGWREAAMRAALGLPLLFLLLLVDVPITLLGPLRSVLVDGLDPGAFDVWVAGSSFLRSGGRYLVALAGAALACLAAQSLARSLARKAPAR